MRSWDAPRFSHLTRNHVIFEGPSMLTGDPILVVATAKNGNRKLGDVLQLWAIPLEEPIAAVKSGGDAAVCGDCKFRGDGTGAERVCYVEHWRSVENIWQARDKAARTSPADFAELIRGKQIRITSYGDPVAVPLAVWTPLLATAAGWTAYTHQWRRRLANPFRAWCMASVDTVAEQLEAERRGWRTFRVRQVDAPIGPNEILCPHERDPDVHCDNCSLCRGQRRPAKSIVITVHGNRAKWFPTAVVVRRGQWGDR